MKKMERLSVFDQINREKISEEEIGLAIYGKLTEVALKYWASEVRKTAAVIKSYTHNCSTFLRISILNEAVA